MILHSIDFKKFFLEFFGMDAAGDFDDIRGEIFNLNGLGKPPAA
ncbi:MAG: hypothetical protein WBW34_04355 [Nitrososphaeraceae archaeon]